MEQPLLPRITLQPTLQKAKGLKFCQQKGMLRLSPSRALLKPQAFRKHLFAHPAWTLIMKAYGKLGAS
jgi:hypothetical protein